MIATTIVTVLRGETTDEYGDPVESNTPVASGVPVSILESSSSPNRPADGREDNVRAYTMRFRPSLTLRKDDRVRDERSGRIYTVDEVVEPTNPAGHHIRRAVLRRVT